MYFVIIFDDTFQQELVLFNLANFPYGFIGATGECSSIEVVIHFLG